MLTDQQLKQLITEQEMISPYIDSSIRINERGVKCPSYGLSHVGYDIRLQSKFKRLKRKLEAIDSLNDNFEEEFELIEDKSYVLKAKSFVLSVSQEYFKMPDNVVGSLFAKSTLARLGLFIPPTIIEPGWSGELVVEIFNTTERDIIIHSGVGIGQVIFFKLDQRPSITYKEKLGKYQDQTGIQLPIN